MESTNNSGSSESGNDGPVAGPSKPSSALTAATRMLRNKAEKQRRDRLNGYISELATLVPMVANSTKPCDKVSILRLAASQMRLNISCLNPKKFNGSLITLPEDVMQRLDLIEKNIGGFVMATTFDGCIVWCSTSIEDYVGYQNIDVIGNSLYHYIHIGDARYLGKKVESIIKSQKESKRRKTKKIRAHMQQRPLPRTNDVRYRKMIFQISVFLNSPKGETPVVNGDSLPSKKYKKTGRTKDFGANGVVLMFVEPVRLEPEIDITYIESHQDAYFTMHGLKGEIIYADQRISTITGYMPTDVQYTSAYRYICSSDVPIALFAQQAMFSSNDGTGVIVYRLRIADMRFIYLQSSGQIAYKDSSTEISHFVCFNKLLSDEIGSQELKKFQQRFAPQIMAAKVRENGKTTDPRVSDEAVEHAMKIMSSLESAPEDPTTSAKNIETSKKPVLKSASGKHNVKRSKNDLTSSTCLPGTSVPGTSKSVIVSKRHSLTNNKNNVKPNSVPVPITPKSMSWTSETNVVFVKPRTPEETKAKSILKQNWKKTQITDYNTVPTLVKETVIQNNVSLGQEVKSVYGVNLLENVLDVDHPNLENMVNGYLVTPKSEICSVAPLRNEAMHSLYEISPMTNGIPVNNTIEGNNYSHSNILLDHLIPETVSNNMNQELNDPQSSSLKTLLLSNVNCPISDGMEYVKQVPYFQATETSILASAAQDFSLPITNGGLQGQMPLLPTGFSGEQFVQGIDLTKLSNLPVQLKHPNSSLTTCVNGLPPDSGPVSSADYCNSGSLYSQTYPENGGYRNDYLCRNGSIEKNVNVDECLGISVLNQKPFLDLSELDSNAYQELKFERANSLDVNSFNPVNNFANGDIPRFQNIENVKQSVPYQCKIPSTNESDGLQIVNSPVDYMDWNRQDFNTDITDNLDLNKELYSELDTFFQNLPQQTSSFVQGINTELSHENTCFPHNNISLTAKKVHK